MAAASPPLPLLLLLTAALFSTAVQAREPEYREFVREASLLPIEEQYDYIVVGGGTAGCPLAATLSNFHSVLLLERGGAPYAYPDLATQDGFSRIINQPPGGADDPAEHFRSEDGVHNTRGRVLGGSSAINAGFYSRAHSEFYEDGVVAWDMRLVTESYEWVERAVAFRPVLKSWQAAFKDGLVEANVTPWNSFTVDHVAGTKIGATTFDSSGKRHSAADLLTFGRLGNLHVAIHANVEHVLFNTLNPGAGNQAAAIGVEYVDRIGRRHKAMTVSGGEVILSAGALGSPQLLLLSGIGPQRSLSELGIPMVLDAPWVGQQMADNPRVSVTVVPSEPIVDHSLIQVVGIPNAHSGPYLEAASLVVPFRPTPDAPFPLSSAYYVTIGLIISKISGPRSTGFLRLRTTNPRDAPLVRFNYFSNPEDLATCVEGARKIGRVVDGKAMEVFKIPHGQVAPAGDRVDFRFLGDTLPANRSDDEAMRDFCRTTMSTIWHYHGGCVTGKVVDGEYRVMGVSGLRVVDGSTFIVSPGTNPQATLMMLGRYMGRKISRERSSMGPMENKKRRRTPKDHQ